jgi:ankyrin repeat protein
MSMEEKNTDAEKAFFEAALDGDLDKLSALLNQQDNPVNINSIFQHSFGDLSVLKKKFSEDTLNILGFVDKDWGTYHLSIFKPTALFLAVCQRHAHVCEYLLSQGALFGQDLKEDGANCLKSEMTIATRHHDIETMKVLLANDWTQVYCEAGKKNVVSLAAKYSNTDMLKTIIASIPEESRLAALSAETQYKNGNALYYALKHKKMDNATAVLESGLKIDEKILCIAVESLESFRFVERNSEYWKDGLSWSTTVDEDNNNPLHLLLERLNWKTTTEAEIADIEVMAIDLIKKYGLNVNAPGFLSESALHLAIDYQSLSLVTLLCQEGARLTKNEDGQDPIEELLVKYDLTLPERRAYFVSILNIFQKYAILGMLSSNSLCIAAHLGLNDIVSNLLDLGIHNKNLHANVISTTSGLSILQVAASAGKKEMVELLLTRGADPHYINFNGDNILNICALSGQFDLLDFFKKKHNVIEVFNKQDKKVKDFLSVSFINKKNLVDFKVISSFSQVTSNQLDDMLEGILNNVSLIDSESLENILRTVTEIISFKNYMIFNDAISGINKLFELMNSHLERVELLGLLVNNLDNIVTDIVIPSIRLEHKKSFKGFIVFSTLIDCQHNHAEFQKAIKPYLETDFVRSIEKEYNQMIVNFHKQGNFDLYPFLRDTKILYQYFSPETHQRWYQFFLSNEVKFSYDNRDHAASLSYICFSLSPEETLVLINHTLEKTRSYPTYKYRHHAIYYLHALSSHSMNLSLCKKRLSTFSAHKIFSVFNSLDNEVFKKFIVKFPKNEWLELYEIFYQNIEFYKKSEKNVDYFESYRVLFEIFMSLDNEGSLFKTISEDLLILWSHDPDSIWIGSDLGDLLLRNIGHYFNFQEQCHVILEKIMIQDSKCFNVFEKELIYQYSHGMLNIKSTKEEIQHSVYKDLTNISMERINLQDVLKSIYLIVHNKIQFTDEQHHKILIDFKKKGTDIFRKYQESHPESQHKFPQSLYLFRFLIRFMESSHDDRNELLEKIDFHAWWCAERFDDRDKNLLLETGVSLFKILKSAFPAKPAQNNGPLLVAYQPEDNKVTKPSSTHTGSKSHQLR